MRINAQMFEGTIRVFGQQAMTMSQQIAELIADNANLRRDLEEARSTKLEREAQIAMATEKNMRINAGFQKLLQIGSVVVAKMGGGDDNNGQHPSTSQIGMMLGEFFQSLRSEQKDTLLTMLDMQQKMMLMEIHNLLNFQEQPGPGNPGGPNSPGPGGGMGGPGSGGTWEGRAAQAQAQGGGMGSRAAGQPPGTPNGTPPR